MKVSWLWCMSRLIYYEFSLVGLWFQIHKEVRSKVWNVFLSFFHPSFFSLSISPTLFLFFFFSFFFVDFAFQLGFPSSSAGKESAFNAGVLGSIPGLGRCPGEGKDYPLQYSGLENSMDCIVQGVTKSQTQLSDFHFPHACCTAVVNIQRCSEQ